MSNVKKVVLSLLATAAIAFSAQPASAWTEPGHLVQLSAHTYRCDPDGNFCQKSLNPNDPSRDVGDVVKTNYPDRGIETGIIVAIGKSDDSGGHGGDNSHPIQVDVVNEATGVVDHIATSSQ